MATKKHSKLQNQTTISKFTAQIHVCLPSGRSVVVRSAITKQFNGDTFYCYPEMVLLQLTETRNEPIN